MAITFDPAKDKSNMSKHGISLADAKNLNWDSVKVKPDTRKDYHELREIGYGLTGDRLHCVVLVKRGKVFHIISLRLATNKEVNEYIDNAKIVAPTTEEDTAIQAAIAADPDTYELSKTEFKQLKPLRGHPLASTTKVQTTVRFDADIIQAFKQAGDGWQTRMNDALREWLATHPH